MAIGGPCWAYTYAELSNGPSCDPDFWPTTYQELVDGPPDFTEWRCWVTVYATLMAGPICDVQPEPTPEMGPLVCPTRWARLSTGGAWQNWGDPSEEWAAGLLFVPLMHDCSLPWGHAGDHWCACEADHVKPGEEGLVTPPLETLDPITDGVLPGPITAALQPLAVEVIDPAEAHQQRVDELSRILDAAPVD